MKNDSPERSYFDRAVALEREKQGLAEDIAEVYSEAKEAEVNIKALRLAVKRHLENNKKRKERERTEEEAVDLLIRLGHLAGTPLGDAAVTMAGRIQRGEVDIKMGDAPWMSEQLKQ